MSSKAPAPEPEVLEVKLPKKAKKERSEAQKAVMMKGLAALKAKREAAAAVEKDENDAKLIAKEKVRNAKKANPGTDLATKKELQEFMENVKTLITKPTQPEPPAEAPVLIEKKKKKIVVEESSSEEELPVKVKKLKPKPVAAPAAPAPPQPQVVKLSGHALLDSIFFNH